MKVENYECDICREGRAQSALAAIIVSIASSNVYEKDVEVHVREACDTCRQKTAAALQAVITTESFTPRRAVIEA